MGGLTIRVKTGHRERGGTPPLAKWGTRKHRSLAVFAVKQVAHGLPSGCAEFGFGLRFG